MVVEDCAWRKRRLCALLDPSSRKNLQIGCRMLSGLHLGLRPSPPILLPPSPSFTSLSINQPLVPLTPTQGLLTRRPKLTQMPRATLLGESSSRALAFLRRTWAALPSAGHSVELHLQRAADADRGTASRRPSAQRLLAVRTSGVSVPTGKVSPRAVKD